MGGGGEVQQFSVFASLPGDPDVPSSLRNTGPFKKALITVSGMARTQQMIAFISISPSRNKKAHSPNNPIP